MSYSQFTTLALALNAFSLNICEQKFFPLIEPIAPSEILQSYLNETLPIAASGSEKVRSEGIIFSAFTSRRNNFSFFGLDASTGIKIKPPKYAKTSLY